MSLWISYPLTRPSAGLRRLVLPRARARCEYCGVPESHAFARHQVDHVVPEKHGGGTSAENLALSCTLCNRRKGSDLAAIDPQSGQAVPLYNPRTQRWGEHFAVREGIVRPLTPEGRATTALLRLNDPARVLERLELARAGMSEPPPPGES